MANEFIWRDPEAAKQAIAQMQVAAAAAENQSRERIAKEQTASQRYATASQIAERDKDRAVAREDIASRSRYGTAAVNQERGNIQYNTILDSITAFDPPTRRELEAVMANSLLSDDLKNALRAERERVYKVAKHNFETGDQAARNYKTELAGKKPGDIGLDKIYERISNDKNVIFDRATNSVESRHRAPREDASPGQANILGATRPGGVFPSAQEMQALGTSPAAPVAGPKVTSLDEIRAQVGSSSLASPSPQAAAPAPSVNAFGVPTFGAMLKSIPISPYGGPAMPSFGRAAPAPRMADIAAPPAMEPGWFTVPPELMPPQAQPPAENRLLQILEKMPQFAMLPPAGKQMVLDQVTGGLMSLPDTAPPRVSDFQTVRPEFVPQDPGYYVAPQ